VGVFNVMHSAISDTGPGLEILRARWDGPIGAYPECGTFTMPSWQFVDAITPEDLVREARVWRDLGAGLFGGCCGLGPQHVRALYEEFKQTIEFGDSTI
jgi:S-methylmethionine-dependent homocysteine/selenocysteine methylase